MKISRCCCTRPQYRRSRMQISVCATTSPLITVFGCRAVSAATPTDISAKDLACATRALHRPSYARRWPGSRRASPRTANLGLPGVSRPRGCRYRELKPEHIDDGAHPGSESTRYYQPFAGVGKAERSCSTINGCGPDCSRRRSSSRGDQVCLSEHHHVIEAFPTN